MAVKHSTGAINYYLDTGSFKALFTNAVISIYTGAQPVNADAAATGTYLGDVTVGGLAFTPGSPTNGLNFDDAVGKSISKAAAETWIFKGIAAGTMGWFRLKGNAADNGLSSTTLPRIDGSCGVGANGDLHFTSLGATIGGEKTCSSFTVTGA